MSFAQILEEVAHLTDSERLELASDAARTADMAARLDRTLTGTDAVMEEQLHRSFTARCQTGVW